MSTAHQPTADDWRVDAACRSYPTAWWFPDPGESGMSVTAAAICERCLVRTECLADAMADPVCRVHGLWAGTTPDDRRQLHRKRRNAAA